ncbi:probable tRNA(His) guanylyltransferase [Episyrphus balteatus]|uniref:probable tRNA(His) guanylyltransferase n=1 Tax=Episyrphus balteatus TaxID=286459 RepID=UPI0024859C66|nr:probable tRNA(His) guanylyltransferase [Episyrphus balteatus]
MLFVFCLPIFLLFCDVCTMRLHSNCKTILNILKRNFNSFPMACSRYEYVKNFELDDTILPNVWIVVRLDGKGFHKFTKTHDFQKPNDINALNVMNSAAIAVMEEFRDIVISFGQSDEYSFVLRKETKVYSRRSSKLLSYITSLFSSAYVMNWKTFFNDKELKSIPCFDGRVVLYPSDQNLKDYMSWRQADVHVNNLYNTTFWELVLNGGMTNTQAEERLRGTFSADKNEILFSQFGINYNELPVMFRKGTILLRKYVQVPGSDKKRQLCVPLHEDMIREKFWKDHPELLGKYVPAEHILKKEDSDDINILLSNQFEKCLIK